MKKIFSTILTLAVLGGGYVGAKAFEKEAAVRQSEAWFPVIEGQESNQSDPAFSEETSCAEPLDQTCARLYEVDAQGNPTTLIESVDGMYIQ